MTALPALHCPEQSTNTEPHCNVSGKSHKKRITNTQSHHPKMKDASIQAKEEYQIATGCSSDNNHNDYVPRVQGAKTMHSASGNRGNKNKVYA